MSFIETEAFKRQSEEFDAVRELSRLWQCQPAIVDDDYPRWRGTYERAANAFVTARQANVKQAERTPTVVPDNWLRSDVAAERLNEGGYFTDFTEPGYIIYRKTGISGRIRIGPHGVDGVAVDRLLDRGS